MKKEIETQLRKVLAYVLENEANHFNEWCANGGNPDDHIYKNAYIVQNYIDLCKPRPAKS